MIEKGIKHSRPFLVCSLNPYVISDKDLELLTKEESRAWWEKKETPKEETNIIKKAMEEADIVFGMESPKLPFYLGEEEETEMAVESIQESENDVKDREDEKVIGEVKFDEIGVLDLTVGKERESKIVEEKIYVEESPLDLRIVRRREDRAEEKKKFEEWNEEEENVNEVEESEAFEGGNRKEEDIRDDKNVKRNEIQEIKKVELKSEGRSRAKRRVRRSLKRSRSSSSSSSSDSSSDASSSEASETDERERKFCKIMCNLVKETGNIIGGQIISNAEMINKLQRTVDELRKEVAELKKDKGVERKGGESDRNEEKGIVRQENDKRKPRETEQKENRLDCKFVEGEERGYRGERVLADRGLDRRDRRYDNHRVESWRRNDWNRGYRY
jgi:hypothetical protein